MTIERNVRHHHGTPDLVRFVRKRTEPAGPAVDWLPMTSQKWTSPTSAASPAPWVVKQSPPEWLTERAAAEAWPADAVETWRAALVELGVKEVHLTSDIRGVTIDADGAAQQ